MLDLHTVRREYFESRDPRIKLLEEINDISIYTFFIGRPLGYGEFIQSPLRVDSTPSFNIYPAKDPKWTDQILFKDYSGPSGNVFQFVCYWAIYHDNIYLETAQQVVDYIRANLKLGGESSEAIKQQTPPILPSKTYYISAYESYTPKHKEYLDDLGIDKKLAMETYYVLPCEYLMNEYQQVIHNFRGTTTFAYMIFDKFKIYQPFEENFLKFFNHCPANYVQGYQQCKVHGQDTLIITKSMKDILVIQSHTNRWYDTIAPHGEGYNTSPWWLEWYLTYPRIILMFDPDITGIHGMNQLRKDLVKHPHYKGQQIDIRFIYKGRRVLKQGKMIVPVKDTADFRYLFGGEATRSRLQEILY